MRPQNLLVLAQGLSSVPLEQLSAFDAQLFERDEPMRMREHEMRSVVRLTEILVDAGLSDPAAFEGFVYSFAIPQISCEFDLLRIQRGQVVNIELKSTDVGVEKIGRQLERTRYYLTPLGRVVHTFTFVSESETFFERDAEDRLREVGPTRLVEVLKDVGSPYGGRVEDLFRASTYLVSPLNDVERFLEGEYFLTNQQAMIKADYLSALDGALPGPFAFLVRGSAGTGKSLLLYDLAKSCGREGTVCVVHCGRLCEGHRELNRQQQRFHVVAEADLTADDLADSTALFVDEAQRLSQGRLEELVGWAHERLIPLYVSLDWRDPTSEENAGLVRATLAGAYPTLRAHELSRRIRANRELSGFVRALFGLKGHGHITRTHAVKVCYASDSAGAQPLVNTFRAAGYRFIALPGEGELHLPGSFDVEDVVGQEFERVVMAPGPGIILDERGCPTAPEQLFQGLTRARSRIALVVFDNQPLLGRLLGLLA